MGQKENFLKFPFSYSFWLFLVLVCFQPICCQDQDDIENERDLNSNPYRHREMLDPRGRYQLEWAISWPEKRVVFNVTAATSGYVGFGLSKKGKMGGADIVIGGVDPNGKIYFSDRYAISNQLPEIDHSQDWTLHEALEEDGQTFLSFSRPFDTCDEDQDLPITDDLLTIIWAYGEKDDDILYHYENRGAYPIYLLDPDLVPNSFRTENPSTNPIDIEIDTEKLPESLQVFRIERNMTLPAQDTLYWCTFHKTPTTTKQHITGFSTKFDSQRNRPFVHHMNLYRCFAPPGSDPDEFFEEALDSQGSECYLLSQPNPLPITYCRELLHSWGVGGKPFFFPEHLGIPMSENGSEYFMLQAHYDNPDELPGRRVAVALEAYYTNSLRENDAGTMFIGQLTHTSASFIVPPSSLGHAILGQCAAGCTQKMFGSSDGISIFGAFLHTHISGRGLRLLHFRGHKELPWVIGDDNFDARFQQNRMLNEERKVLPGDTLMTRCVYETTNRNGSAIVGGYPTRSEMCLVAIYYYNRVPGYGDCRSETRTERYAKFIGIRNTTFDSIRREAVITEPEIYSSLSVETFANDVIDWDLGTRAELQRLHLYQPQISTCRNYIPRDITRTATNRARVARQAIYEPTPLTLAAVPFTPTPRAFVPTSNPFVPPPKNWKPMYTPKPWVRKPKLKQKVEKVINGLQGILDNFLEKTADKNLGGFKRQKNYSPIYTPSPPLYTPLHPIYTRSTPIFISSTTTTSTTTTSTTSTTSTTTTSTTTTTTPPPPTTVAPPPLTEFEEDNIEHVTVLPRDIPRYQRPSDCKRKRWER